MKTLRSMSISRRLWLILVVAVAMLVVLGLLMLRQIIARCEEARVPLSFCGEDAGRPVEALTFAALGIGRLSMRPASIGPVKHLIRRVSITELRKIIDEGLDSGRPNLRRPITEWLAQQ